MMTERQTLRRRLLILQDVLWTEHENINTIIMAAVALVGCTGMVVSSHPLIQGLASGSTKLDLHPWITKL